MAVSLGAAHGRGGIFDRRRDERRFKARNGTAGLVPELVSVVVGYTAADLSMDTKVDAGIEIVP